MSGWLAAAMLALAGSPAQIASSVGSGDFGRWQVDRFGLPSYSYRIDEQRNPIARQPELGGATGAQHQIGNDHIVAAAYNHGYVQLWSQDRRYEWVNRDDPAHKHFAGGYGYLKVGRRLISTLYVDRPSRSRATRRFGTGYSERTTRAADMAVNEFVYAPFGDDPLLLHDVTIRNDSARTRRVSWFEYWDVNPYDQTAKAQVGTGRVRWLPRLGALATTQRRTSADRRPLTIFAAALRGPVDGHAGDTRAFFGNGGRGTPAAVRADRLTGALAPASRPGAPGRAMFALRTAIRLRPHASITLRYAYGAAQATAIPGLLRQYRVAGAPLLASERRWRAWLPQITFGSGRSWLSRELQWDAYTVRSGATYEDCRGRHIVSQGGYYQYGVGFQGAFRDPLEQVLPLIYADPSLARDVLLYSAQEQPRTTGQIPYAMSALCHRYVFGDSDDLDLWLLWAAAEYGLGSRDLRAFDRRVPYAEGGSGTLWDHLKLAFRHQQSLLRTHGGYAALASGDWSDLSTQFLQMTESTLVTAEAAYIYPRLAELAQARGDHAFAARSRAAGLAALSTTRGQWTARGWYARGYAGSRRIGTGAIFGETQPWAILAGAPNRQQARTLVANIRRFLTGVGAPTAVHGPARIGSAQAPAATDSGVTEHAAAPGGLGAGAAVFPGGSWYAVDGWLTWALGTLGDRVPGARRAAFDEFLRNTLAAHATAYPRHWDGTISVDDVCHAFYSPTPATCGIGLMGYAGQIMHQPAWSLFDAIALAGVTPTSAGYRIVPHLPMRSFSLALPDVGVAYAATYARGYVVTAASGSVTMAVAAPGGGHRRWRVTLDGVRSRALAPRHGLLSFRLPTHAGRVARWSVSLPRPTRAHAPNVRR
jgi:hypothetical protein